MKNGMHSCILILPFFGKFHNYFHLWLQSVRNNPTIDFLIVTDCHDQMFFPDNVYVVYMSFGELKKRIQNCFDFNIILDKPYKLCDYKPAYGVIFSDFINYYDFWGHCDCDLIFGDIRHFISDEIFESFNRILIWGHLCLYRNDSSSNEMFKKKVPGVRYYKDVYQSERIYCFDESCGATPIWNALCPMKVFDALIFDDVDYNKWPFHPIGIDNEKAVIYEYKSGKLFRLEQNIDGSFKKTETCYLHLQKREMSVSQLLQDNINHFCIVPNAFVSYDMAIRKYRHFVKNRLFYLKPIKVFFKHWLNKLKWRLADLNLSQK